MFLAQHNADILWMLVCAALVMLMQGGFCLLESGLARAKNSINVAIKNAIDFCISMLLFWLCGFGLMFGAGRSGLFGTTLFMPDATSDPWLLAFFLFQVVFCGTATTIISGAIAERARFSGYLVVTAIVSGLLYPVFGHWAWGGVVPGTEPGWLSRMGFIDFAGSTVVHSLGGWAALAAAIVIGPRLGRFSKKRPAITGHNLPMATIGTLMLWFGWFGFNGGSTLAVNDAIPLVLVNTNLSAAAGGLAALGLSWMLVRRPDVGEVMNGIIAGLVGITACCHVVTPLGAIAVGAIGAVVCSLGMRLLARLRIDDVIGAIPAHAMAGAWGTLAVALLGRVEAFGTGLGRWEQLGVQAIGVGTCFAWAFGLGFVVFAAINRVWSLRVGRRAECEGLNVAEHGASTDLVDLLTRMNVHRERGVFTRVAVEPHTEVGQIAAGYNRVLDRVTEEMERRENAMRAAREAEEKYRGIFENALEGIYRSSPEGRLLDANASLARILGYDSADDLIAGINDVGTQFYADADRRAEFVRSLDDHRVLHGLESTARRRDGTEITVCENARAVCDDDGRVLYYEGSIEDVTQRRLHGELERAHEAAQARDRAKSAFLANMSHEIRTPLNGVVGMLELLARTSLDDRQSRFVRVAASSAEALLSLINDVLDFSKIEAGKLEVERIPFDLPVLLEDVAEMFGHQVAHKGIELTCFVRPDIPTRVVGDPERLRQILVNLVGNALKFTQSGEIRIEASREPNDPFVRLAVSDTGIGIDPDRQLELFTPFAQLDASTTRQYGGTGLGLAICSQLADLMGGGMRLDSTPGHGSTFTCIVPLPGADDLRDRPRSGHVLAGVRVVAVDDNETNREILSEQLAAWGVEVDVFADPHDVLAALERDETTERPYRIAILDQHMPGLTGVELAAAIRKRPAWRNLRIAILSSVDDVVEASLARRIGVHATMTKPIRQSRLFDVLVGLLRDNVTLPSMAGPHDSSPARLSGRVLVAEDNDVNQLVIRELLDEFGIECVVVANGALAVERLRREVFDAVLMDCQMPVLDGFEATCAIRELETRGELPTSRPVRIVALTANAVKGDRERCLRAGMDDYVTKPIDPEVLRTKLEALLAAAPPQGGWTDLSDTLPMTEFQRPTPVHPAVPDRPDPAARDPRVLATSPPAPILPAAAAKKASPTTADPGMTAPRTFETIDLAALEDRCLGKLDLVERVLAKFADRLPADVAALEEALATGEVAEVRRLAHALKGSAGNVSAIALAEQAALVESAAAGGDDVGLRVGIGELSHTAGECRRRLAAILDLHSPYVDPREAGSASEKPNGVLLEESSCES